MPTARSRPAGPARRRAQAAAPAARFGSMHLHLAALLLLVVALPSGAGELIRYRTADGSIGFVDDEKRLPAGVEILSRSPLDPPAPPAVAPAPAPAVEGAPPAIAGEIGAAADAEAAAASEDAGPVPCEELTDLRESTRCWRERSERCSHHGLSSRCAPTQLSTAEEWCARGEELRAELPAIEEAHDLAEERAAACERSGGMIAPDCDTEELEDAGHALRGWERRMEALEEQCHAEECLPGWVREGCAFDPSS